MSAAILYPGTGLSFYMVSLTYDYVLVEAVLFETGHHPSDSVLFYASNLSTNIFLDFYLSQDCFPPHLSPDGSRTESHVIHNFKAFEMLIFLI